MPRTCQFCGKHTTFGKSITRRGLAKKKGGVGRKTTGISVRKFKPNLQRMKAVIKGKTKTINVCTKCLHMGKVTRPIKKAVST